MPLPVANVDPPDIIHDSLSPYKHASILQTGSLSVQPFLHDTGVSCGSASLLRAGTVRLDATGRLAVSRPHSTVTSLSVYTIGNQHVSHFNQLTSIRLMALFRDYPGEPVPET